MIKEFAATIYRSPYGQDLMMTVKVFGFDRNQAERNLDELCQGSDKHWCNLEEIQEVGRFIDFKDGCFDLQEELQKEENEYIDSIPRF